MRATFVTALLTACYLMAVLAVTMITFAGIAHAESSAGADAINGAYQRMLTYEPAAGATAVANASGRVSFEQMVNAAVRGERQAGEWLVDAARDIQHSTISGRSAY